MKRPGFLIVWPAHLDSSKTRGQGRRLPVSRAVKQPSLKEVWQAAMSLAYSAEAKEKAALSGSPWERTAVARVIKTGDRAVGLKVLLTGVVTTGLESPQAAGRRERTTRGVALHRR